MVSIILIIININNYAYLLTHIYSNRWSVCETSVLPMHLTSGPPVHSLCPVFDLSKTLGVAGGNTIVGVAGGDMLVWYVIGHILKTIIG